MTSSRHPKEKSKTNLYMRKLYLSVLAVMACLASFAATLTATGGNFHVSNSWNPKQVPSNGDVLIIPNGITININNATSLNNISLEVYGTLTVSSQLNISVIASGAWSIVVGSTGQITGTGTIAVANTAGGTTTVFNNTTVGSNNSASYSLSPSFQSTSPLPVKFAGFSVARQGGDVLVQWSTAEELAALSFEVERSTDGNTWNRIATIAARGNSSSLTNYAYNDRNVTAAIVYYRIRQVDIDGKAIYTTIQSVKLSATAADVKVAAISNRVVLQFPAQVKGAVEARVMTLSGQVISKQVLQQPVGQVTLNTPSVKGAYIISVSNGQEINVAKQVIL